MGGLGGYGIAGKGDLTQIMKKRAQSKRSGSREAELLILHCPGKMAAHPGKS